jgi:hypothetical protein
VRLEFNSVFLNHRLTRNSFLSSVRDHAGLSRYIPPKSLRLLSIIDCTTNQLRITDATLEALCFQLNIPLAFLEAVLEPNIWANQSGSSFHRWKDMQLESIGMPSPMQRVSKLMSHHVKMGFTIFFMNGIWDPFMCGSLITSKRGP